MRIRVVVILLAVLLFVNGTHAQSDKSDKSTSDKTTDEQLLAQRNEHLLQACTLGMEWQARRILEKDEIIKALQDEIIKALQAELDKLKTSTEKKPQPH